MNKNTSRHPEKINNPINPIKKKPIWIRSKIINTKEYFATKEIINKKKLHTVCQEASCPNISECWSKRHATFMIMGDTCTRACAFCNVKTGKPGSLDPLEPNKIALATKPLSLHWTRDYSFLQHFEIGQLFVKSLTNSCHNMELHLK